MEEKTPHQPVDRTAMFCIIGAGSSGITAAKNLSQSGIPCEVFEREDGIGGNWYYGHPNSSVCRSTHLISSKPLTGYTDFPMPTDFPDYPSHEQVLAYFKAYTAQFNLERFITATVSVWTLPPSTSRSLVPSGARAGTPTHRPNGSRAADHAWRGKGTADGSS